MAENFVDKGLRNVFFIVSCIDNVILDQRAELYIMNSIEIVIHNVSVWTWTV